MPPDEHEVHGQQADEVRLAHIMGTGSNQEDWNPDLDFIFAKAGNGNMPATDNVHTLPRGRRVAAGGPAYPATTACTPT